jgi:hypothetical protein
VRPCHHLWGKDNPNWSNSESLRESLRSNNGWRNCAQRSSKSSGVATMAAQLDVCCRCGNPPSDDAEPSTLEGRQAHEEPQSTRNNRKRGTSPHLSTPVLATITMRATSSTRTKGTRRMDPPSTGWPLRQRRGPEPIARTPRTADLQPRHPQHAVPSTVPATCQRHRVLRENEPRALA